MANAIKDAAIILNEDEVLTTPLCVQFRCSLGIGLTLFTGALCADMVGPYSCGKTETLPNRVGELETKRFDGQFLLREFKSKPGT
jgi:hypothetical protein